MSKNRTNFEKLEVYKLSEILADKIWLIVCRWKNFEKNTIGRQIVKSTDSIGANIAEGVGRFNFADNKRFVKIARGSLYETKHWLRRSFKRKLLCENETNEIKIIIDELSPKLNAYLNSIGKNQDKT